MVFYIKDASINATELENSIENFDLDSILMEHNEFLQKNSPFKESDRFGLYANGWVSFFG